MRSSNSSKRSFLQEMLPRNSERGAKSHGSKSFLTNRGRECKLVQPCEDAGRMQLYVSQEETLTRDQDYIQLDHGLPKR